jgi:hypothetical protein
MSELQSKVPQHKLRGMPAASNITPTCALLIIVIISSKKRVTRHGPFPYFRPSRRPVQGSRIRLQSTNTTAYLLFVVLAAVHILVTTLVASQSLGGLALRRPAFNVCVRVLVLVAASHADHWPLLYLQTDFRPLELGSLLSLFARLAGTPARKPQQL